MAYVLYFLWLLVWGLAGYFTVRAIQMHIENRRFEKALASCVRATIVANRRTMKTEDGKEIVYYPFEGLL